MASLVPFLFRHDPPHNERHENIWKMVLLALVVITAIGFCSDGVDELTSPSSPSEKAR